MCTVYYNWSCRRNRPTYYFSLGPHITEIRFYQQHGNNSIRFIHFYCIDFSRILSIFIELYASSTVSVRSFVRPSNRGRRVMRCRREGPWSMFSTGRTAAHSSTRLAMSIRTSSIVDACSSSCPSCRTCHACAAVDCDSLSGRRSPMRRKERDDATSISPCRSRRQPGRPAAQQHADRETVIGGGRERRGNFTRPIFKQQHEAAAARDWRH